MLGDDQPPPQGTSNIACLDADVRLNFTDTEFGVNRCNVPETNLPNCIRRIINHPDAMEFVPCEEP